MNDHDLGCGRKLQDFFYVLRGHGDWVTDIETRAATICDRNVRAIRYQGGFNICAVNRVSSDI